MMPSEKNEKLSTKAPLFVQTNPSVFHIEPTKFSRDSTLKTILKTAANLH
jgi:hypothetical protein